MKNYIILILLLLLFGCVLYLMLKKEPIENFDELNKAKTELARATSLQAISDTLVNRLQQRKQSDSIVIQNLRKQAKRLTIKQTQQRKDLKPVTDSIPSVELAFETDDSLTLLYMHALDSCQAQKERQYQDFKEIIVVKDSAFQSSQDANLVLQTIVTDQDKAIKKGKRREKILKVLIPVAFALGILVAI
jgi:hypothetical protein